MAICWYLLDEAGEPVPTDNLGAVEALMNDDRRVVARDLVGLVFVSTVFCTVDLSFGLGAPQLFETKVFGGRLDFQVARYATRAEAVLGHAAMVERVLVAESPEGVN